MYGSDTYYLFTILYLLLITERLLVTILSRYVIVNT